MYSLNDSLVRDLCYFLKIRGSAQWNSICDFSSLPFYCIHFTLCCVLFTVRVSFYSLPYAIYCDIHCAYVHEYDKKLNALANVLSQ